MLEALATRIRTTLGVPVFIGLKPAGVTRCVLLRPKPTPVDLEIPGLHRLAFAVVAFDDNTHDVFALADAAAAAINIAETNVGPIHCIYVRRIATPALAEPVPGLLSATFDADARWRIES